MSRRECRKWIVLPGRTRRTIRNKRRNRPRWESPPAWFRQALEAQFREQVRQLLRSGRPEALEILPATRRKDARYLWS